MNDRTVAADAHRAWVVMGVSGSGKSSIGMQLAARLGVPFIEGDAYHSPANVAKMAAGVALTDADRDGWLVTLQAVIIATRAQAGGLVLSCSALKRSYRDRLRAANPQLRFLHLAGTRDVIAARMAARVGHYMPLSLLDSQLRALEPLQSDENGRTLDIGLAPDQIIDAALRPL